MKNLNRKGFTLVELLAVIIILAIVVGITIPAVLTTTSNAKKKAFATAATSTADWIDRQYQVVSTGLNGTGIATADANFTAQCGDDGSLCTCTVNNHKCPTNYKKTLTATNNADFFAAAGLNVANVDKIEININPDTGRSCVRLTAKTNGDYQTGTDKNADNTLKPDEKTAGSC